MPTKLTEFRDDSYIIEGWEDIAQGIEYDYEQLNYEELEKYILVMKKVGCNTELFMLLLLQDYGQR